MHKHKPLGLRYGLNQKSQGQVSVQFKKTSMNACGKHQPAATQTYKSILIRQSQETYTPNGVDRITQGLSIRVSQVTEIV